MSQPQNIDIALHMSGELSVAYRMEQAGLYTVAAHAVSQQRLNPDRNVQVVFCTERVEVTRCLNESWCE